MNNQFISSFSIYESLSDLDKLEEKNQVILFTDIKSSSKLWNLHNDGMFEALKEHEARIESIVNKHNGEIIKTIGDSYMLGWDGPESLYRSILAGVDIQADLIKNPIKIKNTNMSIRMGIAWGSLYKKKVKIQNKKLWDYFGNTVNTASRMESTVSEAGEIAFCFDKSLDKKQEEKIVEFLNSKNFKLDIIEYKHKCYSGKRKRSGRLLSDLQYHTCEPLSNLKGVGEVTAYIVKNVK